MATGRLSPDEPCCFVVTDIETDGPEPGRNSMLSLASVAVSERGAILDRFERCLVPLDGASADPFTAAWFKSRPEAWAAATRDPLPVHEAMTEYVAWVRDLGIPGVFTAQPLSFDGFWVDWYLRKFLGLRLAWGFGPGDPPFAGTGLDLGSLVMGVMGWGYGRCRRSDYPEDWFGGYKHTHCALDDALGYAHVLIEMLRRSARNR